MEEEKYHLIASIQQPTVITASETSRFMQNERNNLIVAKLTQIEVYEIKNDYRLKLRLNCRVNGRVVQILNIKRSKLDLDWLIVLTEELNVFFLKYNPEENQIITIANDSNDNKIKRRTLISSMEDSRLLNLAILTKSANQAFDFDVLACFQVDLGKLRFIISKDLSTEVFEVFDVSIEEYHLLDLVSLKTNQAPSFAILYEDAQRRRHLKTYRLNLKEKKLIPTLLFASKLPRSTSHLISFKNQVISASFQGLLGIKLEELSNEVSRTPFALSVGEMSALSVFNDDRLVISDEWGGLHLLGFDENWFYEYLGTTSVASSLSQVSQTHLFLGSSEGDSQMLEFFIDEATNCTRFKEIDSIRSIGPLSDVVSLKRGANTFVSASGKGHSGALKLIRGGTVSERLTAIDFDSTFTQVRTFELQKEIVGFVFGFRGLEVFLKTSKKHEIRFIKSTQLSEAFRNTHIVQIQALVIAKKACFVISTLDGHSIWKYGNRSFSQLKKLTNTLKLDSFSPIVATNEIIYGYSEGKVVAFDLDLDKSKKLASISSETPLKLSSAQRNTVAVLTIDRNVHILQLKASKLALVDSIESSNIENLCFEQEFFSTKALTSYITDIELSEIDKKLFLFVNKSNGVLEIYSFTSSRKLKLFFSLSLLPSAFKLARIDQYRFCCWSLTSKTVSPQVLTFKRTRFEVSTLMIESEIRSIAPLEDSLCVLRRDTFELREISPNKGLSVRSVALGEQPRSLIIENDWIVVVTVKVEPEMEGKQRNEEFNVVEESFVKVFRLSDFMLINSYALEESEQGIVVTSLQLQKQGLVCIGTGFSCYDDSDPKEGRMLVYSLTQSGDLIERVSKRVDGAVYSLTKSFIRSDETHFAAGVNGDVVLFRIEAEREEMKVIEVSRYRKNRVINDLKHVSEDLLVVSDMLSSISVLMITNEGELSEMNRDYSQTFVYCGTQGRADGSFIAADNDCCLSTFRTNVSETASPADKHILVKNGRINVGLQIINFFDLLPELTQPRRSPFGSITPECGYFTLSGGLGCVYSLDFELFHFLSRLQRALASLNTSVGGMDHFDWLAVHSCGQIYENKNIIDGDLLRIVSDLTLEQLETVMNTMQEPMTVSSKRKRSKSGLTAEAVVHLVEDLLISL